MRNLQVEFYFQKVKFRKNYTQSLYNCLTFQKKNEIKYKYQIKYFADNNFNIILDAI